MKKIEKMVNDVSRKAVCGSKEPKTIFEINMVKTFKCFAWQLIDEIAIRSRPCNFCGRPDVGDKAFFARKPNEFSTKAESTQ